MSTATAVAKPEKWENTAAETAIMLELGTRDKLIFQQKTRLDVPLHLMPLQPSFGLDANGHPNTRSPRKQGRGGPSTSTTTMPDIGRRAYGSLNYKREIGALMTQKPSSWSNISNSNSKNNIKHKKTGLVSILKESTAWDSNHSHSSSSRIRKPHFRQSVEEAIFDTDSYNILAASRRPLQERQHRPRLTMCGANPDIFSKLSW